MLEMISRRIYETQSFQSRFSLYSPYFSRVQFSRNGLWNLHVIASGFSFVYPLCMSFLIYGGSLEFVAVEMLEKNMETEYVPVHRCRNDKLYAVTAFFVTLFFIS